VQAAAGSFGVGPGDQGPFWDRQRQWNDDLAPAPWFDAVTVHLYSRLEEVTGDPNANHEPVTEATAQRNFAALMARHDDGTDRVLADLEARVPGKEIWITEWNPRGGQVWVQGQTEAVTPAMALQLVTRIKLACLRHASVTVNLFFMVDFLVDTPVQAFVPDGSGGHLPLPATAALAWFCDAANRGATFQRLLEPSAPRIPGGGSQLETYAAVEGAVFRRQDRVVVLLQNAAADSRECDLTTVAAGPLPSRVETLAAPDLADGSKNATTVNSVAPSLVVTLPPYSVTRVVWETTARTPRKHLHRAAN
jgi:hypothetical protein